MQTTVELLGAALEKKSAAQWCRELGLNRVALNVAKQREKLSPSIAGALALSLGEPAEKWIVIAALEAERETPCKQIVCKALNWRKRWDANSKEGLLSLFFFGFIA